MAFSKQLNFFLSQDDQVGLAGVLDQCPGICADVLPAKGELPTRRNVTDVSEWRPGEHQAVIFQAQDAASIRFVKRGEGGIYLADFLHDPLIEFDRCVTKNDKLIRGRLYVIMAYYNNNKELVRKRNDFIEFADKVFRIAKKFIGTHRRGVYIGRGALELESLGMKLAQV